FQPELGVAVDGRAAAARRYHHGARVDEAADLLGLDDLERDRRRDQAAPAALDLADRPAVPAGHAPRRRLVHHVSYRLDRLVRGWIGRVDHDLRDERHDVARDAG